MGSCAFPVMREFTLVIVGRFRGERSFDPLMKMVDVFFFSTKVFSPVYSCCITRYYNMYLVCEFGAISYARIRNTYVA